MPNRYDVPRSIISRDPKRRLILIYAGIGFMSMLLLVFHFVTRDMQDVWSDSRIGEGRVVEKRIEDEGAPEAVYFLLVRVAVPREGGGGSERDSADVDEGGESTPAHELTGLVVASEEDWRSVMPGSVLRVEYRVDAQYERIVIEAVYLDGAARGG